MRPYRARLVGLALALSLPASVEAWTEAVPAEAELSVAVDPSGAMGGTYRVTIDVDAGRFHGFDLGGMPDGFTIDDAGTRAYDARGRTLGVRASRAAAGRVHIELTSARGETKGRFVFEIAFRARARVLDEDEHAAVEVSTPPWDHGMNQTVVSVEVPVPRASVVVVDPDVYDRVDVAEAPTGATRVTAMRHRLPRWTPMTLRVQVPRPTFAAVLGAPRPEPPRPALPTTPRAPAPPRPDVPWWGLAVLAMLLAAAKTWESRRTARAAGCGLAPVILRGAGAPVRVLLVLSLSGAAAVAGARGDTALSVALLLFGGLVSAVRFVREPDAIPPPGRWVRVEPDELHAIVRRARAVRRVTWRLLDPTTPLGGAFTLAYAAAVAVVTRMLLPFGLETALSVAMCCAAAALVPLLTANGVTLPAPRPAREADALLRLLPTLDAILTVEGGGVGPLARLPEGADSPDRIRLRIGPTSAPSGLRCIELGLEHRGEHARPGAMVRVTPGSAAEAFVRRLRPRPEILGSPGGNEVVAILRADLGGDRAFLRMLRVLLSALHTAERAHEAAISASAPPS